MDLDRALAAFRRLEAETWKLPPLTREEKIREGWDPDEPEEPDWLPVFAVRLDATVTGMDERGWRVWAKTSSTYLSNCKSDAERRRPAELAVQLAVDFDLDVQADNSGIELS